MILHSVHRSSRLYKYLETAAWIFSGVWSHVTVFKCAEFWFCCPSSSYDGSAQKTKGTLVPSTETQSKGTTVYRAIVYGNRATPLTHVKNPPTTVPESHTHQWTVSLHGPGNSDVSHFIKKVVFKLHDSFASPTRCTISPPTHTHICIQC